MLMSPFKLMALRLWCLTIGSSDFGMRVLRRGLVRILITSRKGDQRYNASSRFFTPGEFSRAINPEKTE